MKWKWRVPKLMVWLILPLLFVVALVLDVAAMVKSKLRRRKQ